MLFLYSSTMEALPCDAVLHKLIQCGLPTGCSSRTLQHGTFLQSSGKPAQGLHGQQLFLGNNHLLHYRPPRAAGRPALSPESFPLTTVSSLYWYLEHLLSHLLALVPAELFLSFFPISSLSHTCCTAFLLSFLKYHQYQRHNQNHSLAQV